MLAKIFLKNSIVTLSNILRFIYGKHLDSIVQEVIKICKQRGWIVVCKIAESWLSYYLRKKLKNYLIFVVIGWNWMEHW